MERVGSHQTDTAGLDLERPALGTMDSLRSWTVTATPKDDSGASSIFTGGQDSTDSTVPKDHHIPDPDLPLLLAPVPAQLFRACVQSY